MLRWICLGILSGVIVLGSFLGFLCFHRTAILSSLISRSSSPYTATIGHIENNNGVLCLRNVDFQRGGERHHIDRIEIHISIPSLLSYLFSWKESSLYIEDLLLSSRINLQPQNISPLIKLHVRNLHIGSEESNIDTVYNITGTIPQVLSA